jgi:hypothetical protein
VRIALLLTSVALAAATAGAQTPRPMQETDVSTVTATVVAIDHANRAVVLQGEDGGLRTIKVPPEVKRFSEVKVGDTITARYTESYAVAIALPGSVVPEDQGIQTSRYAGERPSGEMTNKVTARVTVKAIDTKTPAVTVSKSNGEIVDLKVEDGERLQRFKVGDEVDITYTESLMLAVDPKKQ